MELPEVHVDVISRSLEFLKLTLILLPLDTQTDPTCEYQPKMQILIDIAEEGNSCSPRFCSVCYCSMEMAH